MLEVSWNFIFEFAEDFVRLKHISGKLRRLLLVNWIDIGISGFQFIECFADRWLHSFK